MKALFVSANQIYLIIIRFETYCEVYFQNSQDLSKVNRLDMNLIDAVRLPCSVLSPGKRVEIRLA
jgi:hypothetical protein